MSETIGRGQSFEAFGHIDTVPGQHREGILEVLDGGLREVLYRHTLANHEVTIVRTSAYLFFEYIFPWIAGGL